MNEKNTILTGPFINVPIKKMSILKCPFIKVTKANRQYQIGVKAKTESI